MTAPTNSDQPKTRKALSDPTFSPGRQRDLMTPEQHTAYRARIAARRRGRRAYRANRLSLAAANHTAACLQREDYR